jgi:AcrR family transcriptional regulator
MAKARTSGPKARRASPELGDRRRHDLLEAAYMIVGERGLEGLRTRDIAARAGVNIATLHYYFGTKDALLVALVSHTSGKFTAPPKPRRGQPQDPAVTASLRAHLDGAWRTFHTTPHLATVLQELVLRGQRNTATRAAFRALHEGWNRIVEDVLRVDIDRGALRADLDPRAGARIVTSFIMGAMVQLGVHAKAFDFRDVARRLEGCFVPPQG